MEWMSRGRTSIAPILQMRTLWFREIVRPTFTRVSSGTSDLNSDRLAPGQVSYPSYDAIRATGLGSSIHWMLSNTSQ